MFVTVVPYNPDWHLEFTREANKLKDALQDTLQEIYHIGSTSVPGLKAKPVIDIMLAVTDLQSLDEKEAWMQDLGYEARGENGIAGRRYFQKGGDHRSHQVHAFVTGDPHLKRHLAFRDYLIAHPEVAQAYGELKQEIAARCNHDIERYCDEKDPFIKLHEAKALAWHEGQA